LSEITDFGLIVLVVSAGALLALGTSKLTERVPVPAPALFLILAAIASDLAPRLHVTEIQHVERIGVVAIIVILFDGGMHVGWRRFRGSTWPILSLGVVGTFATAALMAVAAHTLFGFGWTASWLLGAALAPTDPAVMFSVLGQREVGGRSGTILEGESGMNDPVGIALVIGLIEFATGDDGSAFVVVQEFVIEMAVGLAMGVAGGFTLLRLMQRVSLPHAGLYPLRTLAGAGAIYGIASVAHGSGFLAVFAAGLILGDQRAPYKGEIERFHVALASLAEIVVFVALGLTIDLSELGEDSIWLDGLLLALILAFIARPLAAAVPLLPARLTLREKVFVMWGGLRGAVPILLAALILIAGAEGGDRIYEIVFVVVAFSVVVQGTSIPYVARRLHVPMRIAEAEPWDLSIRLRREPKGVERFVVGPTSRVTGQPIRELPLGDHGWISLILRGGEPVRARGSTRLEPGDEVIMLVNPDKIAAVRRLFTDSGRPG
jgi:potassium/hydrogen antiporter